MDLITASRLKQRLHYAPETGLFHWASETRGKKVGAVAGYLCRTTGYRMVMLDGRMYRQHRLAHLYMTSRWPSGEIDHINCQPADNRWENLRDVDHSTNQRNRSGRRKGRKHDLPRGVEYLPDGRVRCFRAVARARGVRYHLGYFMTAGEAGRVAERKRAELDRAETSRWA